MASESLGAAPVAPGWNTVPLSPRRSGQVPAHQACRDPRPSGFPRVLVLGLLPCPLPPAPTQAGRKAYPGSAKGSPSPDSSFVFFHQSQVSGSHQTLLCHLAGNPEARAKGKSPVAVKEASWNSGCLKFTVQLNMASTRQWELSPSSSPWGTVVCTPELCPKVTSSCGNSHLSHRA